MFLLLCTNSVGKSILLSSKQKRISYSWNVSLEILLRALTLFFPKDACNESNPRIIDDSRARKLANDLKRWKISNHLMVISSWLIWHFITSLLAGVLTTRPVLLMAWMWSVYSKTVKTFCVDIASSWFRILTSLRQKISCGLIVSALHFYEAYSSRDQKLLIAFVKILNCNCSKNLVHFPWGRV